MSGSIKASDKTLKINELKLGEQAKIVAFGNTNKVYRQRLLAMGLTPGTCFRLLRIAPLGDPIEIEVRGYALTLRKIEASSLQLMKI